MPMKEAGRVYDYVEISMAIDFYVIMDYDISGSDLPWANSPLNITELGMSTHKFYDIIFLPREHTTSLLKCELWILERSYPEEIGAR